MSRLFFMPIVHLFLKVLLFAEISPVMDFLRGGSRRESSSNGQNQAQTDNRRGFGGQSR